jgi:hypothetical protein
MERKERGEEKKELTFFAKYLHKLGGAGGKGREIDREAIRLTSCCCCRCQLR